MILTLVTIVIDCYVILYGPTSVPLLQYILYGPACVDGVQQKTETIHTRASFIHTRVLTNFTKWFTPNDLTSVDKPLESALAGYHGIHFG